MKTFDRPHRENQGDTPSAGEVGLGFNNWGGAYQTQGVLAPGANVVGATTVGGTTVRTGTSFATPIVSGLVGLLASLQLSRGEKVDVSALRAAILENAHPCNPQQTSDCRRFLVGQLNIAGIHPPALNRTRDSRIESQAADQTELPRTTDESQQISNKRVSDFQWSGMRSSVASSSQSILDTTTTPNSSETCFVRYDFNPALSEKTG